MRISSGERVLATLGYLPLLFFLPLKIKRDSMFVQFHARQGGVLFGLWLVLAFTLTFALLFVGNNFLTQLFMGTLFLATATYIVMAIIGIFKVSLGERYRMPLVADVALKLGL